MLARHPETVNHALLSFLSCSPVHHGLTDHDDDDDDDDDYQTLLA